MFSSSSRHRPYRVATLGFSDFERAALASFFRLSDRRVPAYVQVDADDSSDFLIADADQPRVLARIARERRTAVTVFIGEQAPDEALAWLTRPIEPVHIMRALDALLGGRRGGEAAEPPADAVAAPARRHATPGGEAAATASASGPKAPVPDAPGAAPAPGAVPAVPTLAPRPGADRRVLVADAGEAARAALQQRLTGLGYRVSVAASGEEALESADWTAFNIAFVDLNLRDTAGPDGLQLCQALKAVGRPGEAQAPPAVVITTGDRNATDKVRGALAGCDAYLMKPLLEADLRAALRQVDPAFG